MIVTVVFHDGDALEIEDALDEPGLGSVYTRETELFAVSNGTVVYSIPRESVKYMMSEPDLDKMLN